MLSFQLSDAVYTSSIEVLRPPTRTKLPWSTSRSPANRARRASNDGRAETAASPAGAQRTNRSAQNPSTIDSSFTMKGDFIMTDEVAAALAHARLQMEQQQQQQQQAPLAAPAPPRPAGMQQLPPPPASTAAAATATPYDILLGAFGWPGNAALTRFIHAGATASEVVDVIHRQGSRFFVFCGYSWVHLVEPLEVVRSYMEAQVRQEYPEQPQPPPPPPLPHYGHPYPSMATHHYPQHHGLPASAYSRSAPAVVRPPPMSLAAPPPTIMADNTLPPALTATAAAAIRRVTPTAAETTHDQSKNTTTDTTMDAIATNDNSSPSLTAAAASSSGVTTRSGNNSPQQKKAAPVRRKKPTAKARRLAALQQICKDKQEKDKTLQAAAANAAAASGSTSTTQPSKSPKRSNMTTTTRSKDKSPSSRAAAAIKKLQLPPAVLSPTMMALHLTVDDDDDDMELPRGVTIRPSGKWQAQIYFVGQSRYIGVFLSKQSAAAAFTTAQDYLAQARKCISTANCTPAVADKIFCKARTLALQAGHVVFTAALAQAKQAKTKIVSV